MGMLRRATASSGRGRLASQCIPRRYSFARLPRVKRRVFRSQIALNSTNNTNDSKENERIPWKVRIQPLLTEEYYWSPSDILYRKLFPPFCSILPLIPFSKIEYFIVNHNTEHFTLMCLGGVGTSNLPVHRQLWIRLCHSRPAVLRSRVGYGAVRCWDYPVFACDGSNSRESAPRESGRSLGASAVDGCW
eukprot:1339517-Amorphochlora_amoeboformis.AAC.2